MSSNPTSQFPTRPTSVRPGYGDVPERIPAQVHGHLGRRCDLAVPVDRAVEAQARGRREEGEGVFLVVEGVEQDAEPIDGGDHGIAFLGRRPDLARLAVEQASGDIDKIAVVAEQDFGLLRWHLSERRGLFDHRERPNPGPSRFVAAAV
jgi:hypothetical protein